MSPSVIGKFMAQHGREDASFGSVRHGGLDRLRLNSLDLIHLAEEGLAIDAIIGVRINLG